MPKDPKPFSEKLPIELLHQDDSLVAADKPAGLPTVPARGQPPSLIKRLSLQLQLPFKGETDPRLRALHRIDQDTSGVVIFALNRPTQQFISHQFQNNQVQKEYLALVHGRVLESEGQIDVPLDQDPRNPLRMVVPRKGRGKKALTLWKIEEKFRLFTLLRVFPKTGKTHQIRVHLAHIGHPLAVDPLYGQIERSVDTPLGLMLSAFKRGYRSKDSEEERPLIGRLTLHAARLAFTHPNGTAMQLEAPLHKDFRAGLNMLRKYGR
jgi:23S rRNA pseudouridine1911/1915/1917 synthase